MAKFVITWELGAGLGHVSVIGPIARDLLSRGHKVTMIVRDVVKAQKAIGLEGVNFLQAPYQPKGHSRISQPANFTQILFNIGFSEGQGLLALVGAWRGLYDYLSPDVILFDHSPTAMLAAWDHPSKKAVLGTGFEIPPDCSPAPVLLNDNSHASVKRIGEIEDHVRNACNEVVATWTDRAISRVSDIYYQCDEIFLATFEELDHYQREAGTQTFLGCWPNQGGESPMWPSDGLLKVFAYLTPFKKFVAFLKILESFNVSAIVCFAGPIDVVEPRFSSPHVLVTEKPQDLQLIGESCDYGIVTGSHGTTSSLLLSGKPLLCLPNHLEQSITARNVVGIGAGLMANPNSPDELDRTLEQLFTTPTLRENAAGFSKKYQAFCAQSKLDEVVRRIEALSRQ